MIRNRQFYQHIIIQLQIRNKVFKEQKRENHKIFLSKVFIIVKESQVFMFKAILFKILMLKIVLES